MTLPKQGDLYQRAYGVLWIIDQVDMFGVTYYAEELKTAGAVSWAQWWRLKLERVEVAPRS